MGEFLRGWRRKAGLVALMLACILMAAWVRSPLNADFVQFQLGTSYVTFASNQHGLWWVMSELPGSIYQPGNLSFKNQTFALPGHRRPFSNDPFGHLINWSWGTQQRSDWCGFHYGRYCDDRPFNGIHFTFRIIPHWAAVLPLTLISAYLLLAKSRFADQKKNLAPDEIEGT